MTILHKIQNKFVKPQTINGDTVGGRFGAAVMCLNDIDYDGYGDVAVGAPYEDGAQWGDTVESRTLTLYISIF